MTIKEVKKLACEDCIAILHRIDCLKCQSEYETDEQTVKEINKLIEQNAKELVELVKEINL